MSWTDKVKAETTVVSLDRDTTDHHPVNPAPTLGWNPHEVWLTRIQQPRQQATRSTMHASSNPPQQSTAPRDR